MKVWKQGIELEFNVIGNSGSVLKKDERIHRHACDVFYDKVSTRFHMDDDKPEYASKPHDSMGSLSEELESVVTSCVSISKGRNLKLSLLGNYPFFKDFCSGHVHTSMIKMNSKTWLNMRQKLYNAQPIIALLSANSPILNGVYRTPDVRLAFSSWSRFTPFDSIDDDHWMALAYGKNGSTLECRIPSAGPLHQLIGVATLIRVLLEDKDYVLPEMNTKYAFDRVIRYGSQAIVDIMLPCAMTYSGFKKRCISVSIVDLWREYYESNIDLFDKILSTCSSKVREGVKEFYDSVCKGVTLSDKVYAVWYGLKNKTKFIDFISELTKSSYLGNPFMRDLPSPKNIPSQIGFEKIDFEEFKRIIGSIKPKRSLDLHKTIIRPDILKVLFMENGVLDNGILRRLLVTLKTKESIPGFNKRRITDVLINNDIVKEKGKYLIPGKNLNYFIQLLEECEIV